MIRKVGEIMRVIIAGGRDFNNYPLLREECIKILHSHQYKPVEIVPDGARGADKLGEKFAKRFNYPLKVFPANWDKYGKRAGYLRNKEMAEYASPDGMLIAFWDGKSRGTRLMIDLANKYNLEIHVINY